ncbi:hypothetical protein IMSHALPRED_007995 [Imshaugia aleurites]|uniref:Uncharacterized protein n=1 Tax=Imshaugia aleurites TaxID=172621 RepID=A0A8H3IIY7_9LECA|nr:hypothetical protein IMSHALPRED_007995 [Imshaugia aleurites]
MICTSNLPAFTKFVNFNQLPPASTPIPPIFHNINTMAAETDTLPLLPPPANDDPPSFDSHPEFYAPAPPQRPHPRQHSAPIPPTSTTSPSPRGSPTNPFRPPQTTLDHQSQPRHSADADAASLLPAYAPAKYRGHATEEAYLAALRAWAEEKLYTQPADKSTLVGFYGAETMRERIERQPPLRIGMRRKRKEGKGGEGQEGGVGGGEEGGERGSAGGEGRRRRSSIGNWLSRKRTG